MCDNQSINASISRLWRWQTIRNMTFPTRYHCRARAGFHYFVCTYHLSDREDAVSHARQYPNRRHRASTVVKVSQIPSEIEFLVDNTCRLPGHFVSVVLSGVSFFLEYKNLPRLRLTGDFIFTKWCCASYATERYELRQRFLEVCTVPDRTRTAFPLRTTGPSSSSAQMFEATRRWLLSATTPVPTVPASWLLRQRQHWVMPLPL